MKKKDDDLAIPMERTDDILKFLGEHKKEHQFLCGFFHGDGEYAGEFQKKTGKEAS